MHSSIFILSLTPSGAPEKIWTCCFQREEEAKGCCSITPPPEDDKRRCTRCGQFENW